MEKKEEVKEITFEDVFKLMVMRFSNLIHKKKSLRRSLKRGTVNPITGENLKRPYNNRKPTKGRKKNELKKQDYARTKRKSN